MTKPIKIEIPSELLPYLNDNPEEKVKLLLIFELYREKKITLRQAADILKLTYREMEEVLKENRVFINFGKNELDEEFQYGFSSN
ncbi:MAG: hypothetical protein GF383_16435 [Candidatus Lokiarchaeota archaeon]|nr:hypothetical protein [Candidatus Lokiarchaeota archaeon]MBD3343349.1 hypothetical protein [Candidatus Lokiarchaeota archaeon]